MKTRFLILLGVLFLTVIGLKAETIYLTAAVNLDPNGDGRMELQTRCSAQTWRIWKANFGDHPDLILRNLKHQYSRYEFMDYALDKDDVKRVATAKMQARSIATLAKDGRYIVEVPQPARLVSNNGNEWIFNQSAEGGPQAPTVDQTTRLYLPKGATNATLANPDTDYQQVVYSMPSTDWNRSWVLYLGIASGVAGLLCFVLSAMIRTRRMPPMIIIPPEEPPTLPPSSQTPAA